MKTKRIENKFFLTKKNIFSTTKDVATNSPTTIIIPNICDINKIPSAKFYTAMLNEYPLLKQSIDMDGSYKLGTNKYVDIYQNSKYKNKIICANLFCVNKNRTGKQINYGALAVCMINMYSFCKQILSQSNDYTLQIHSPKFGCGSIGGDWRTIGHLIDDIWANDFTVFIYEPS